MKPKPRFYYILFCLLIRVYPVLTQDIYFNKVLSPEGKTFVHVAGIVQDEQGYMWFATKKGLFRSDGYNMISYKNDPSDSNSLSTDALEAICVDKNGMLWIATLGQGIERFNPNTRVFTHFRPDSNDIQSISSDWISAVLIDHEGVLWKVPETAFSIAFFNQQKMKKNEKTINFLCLRQFNLYSVRQYFFRPGRTL